MSSGLAAAVAMMMGAVMPPTRAARSTSNPETCGMFTSSKTRSKLASLPSAAMTSPPCTAAVT